jgi:hypothetical protein
VVQQVDVFHELKRRRSAATSLLGVRLV